MVPQDDILIIDWTAQGHEWLERDADYGAKVDLSPSVFARAQDQIRSMLSGVSSVLFSVANVRLYLDTQLASAVT